MQNQEINRQLQRLRDLIRRTGQACGNDIEMQSHWARYLCVLCAGFIENAIKEIYSDFVKGAASAPVADYAASTISRIQNPQTTRFIETARAFKPQWAHDLEAYLNEEGRKEAIDSIMSNRHLIAHGKSSGITVARIVEYLNKSVEVLIFIETQCAN